MSLLRYKILSLIAPVLMLAGCSNDMKSTLGLKKQAPDEFFIISNPPLIVPPEFDITNPDLPSKNSQRAQELEKLSQSDESFIKKIAKEAPKKKKEDPAKVEVEVAKIEAGEFKDADPQDYFDPVAERDKLIAQKKAAAKKIIDANEKNKKTPADAYKEIVE